VTLTSVPTGRAAYSDTRAWLLEQHGPVCAYCESVVAPRTITLDHVTPRRGQTAYDRRDNLVLCCKACNAAKMDKAILAFLLGNKKRVIALYKYGQHLSHQLLEMVKDLLPEDQRPALPTVPHAKRVRRKTAAEIFGDRGREASPYLDEHAPPAVAPVHRAQPTGVPRVPRVPRAPAPVTAVPAASSVAKKKRSRGGRGRRPKS
jgi:hypothetical protein